MLRTYKPLASHPIFVYQQHVEHLVCNVWCRAEAGVDCQDLLTAEFEIIYNKRDWVKAGVDEVYELCKKLSPDERTIIKEAFYINNNIESFCEGSAKPVELNALPKVVEEKMKPLLVKFYSDLIGAKEKLDYYNKLITQSGNAKFCFCCGITPVESAESRYREDNDHYLPKAEYPFASVNFGNLPPLCSKCNKKCKSTKNPFENGRKSFYAFKPLENEFEIVVSIASTQSTSYLCLKQEEVNVTFNNDADKVDTWHWLFEIDTRFNKEVRDLSIGELRLLKRKLELNRKKGRGETYEQVVNEVIGDYEIDKYDDRKFLKKSFLMEMLNKQDWLAVYHEIN